MRRTLVDCYRVRVRWFLPVLSGSCLLYCLTIYHGADTKGQDLFDDGSATDTKQQAKVSATDTKQAEVLGTDTKQQGQQDEVLSAGLGWDWDDWDDLVYLLAEVSSVPPAHPVNTTCLPPPLYARAGAGRGGRPASPPASCDHGTVLTGKTRPKARRLFMMLLFR